MFTCLKLPTIICERCAFDTPVGLRYVKRILESHMDMAFIMHVRQQNAKNNCRDKANSLECSFQKYKRK